jgi:drug/metabolite transporter (DMT)-like permease
MDRRTVALFLSVCVLWGSAIVALKIGLRHADPIFLGGIRFLLAGIVLGAYAALLGRKIVPSKKDLLPIGLLGVVNAGLLQMFLNLGLVTTSAGIGVILLNTHPVMVAVAAPILLGERLRIPNLAGIVLGFAGVVIAVGAEGEGGPLAGRLLVLAAAASWAAGSLIFKRVITGRDVYAVTAQTIVAGGIFDLVVSGFVEGVPRIDLNPEFWGAFAYMSIPGMALAAALWYYLLERGAAAKASAFLFLIPVFGVFFSSSGCSSRRWCSANPSRSAFSPEGRSWASASGW